MLLHQNQTEAEAQQNESSSMQQLETELELKLELELAENIITILAWPSHAATFTLQPKQEQFSKCQIEQARKLQREWTQLEYTQHYNNYI